MIDKRTVLTMLLVFLIAYLFVKTISFSANAAIAKRKAAGETEESRSKAPSAPSTPGTKQVKLTNASTQPPSSDETPYFLMGVEQARDQGIEGLENAEIVTDSEGNEYVMIPDEATEVVEETVIATDTADVWLKTLAG